MAGYPLPIRGASGKMLGMTYPVVLILGIAGCYFIGAVLEGFATSGSSQWSNEEKQRFAARMAPFEGLLRVIDMAGLAVIVVGLLRHYGSLRFIPLTASRILLIAIGILCIERIVRGWATWHALKEAEQTETRTRGLLAALATTLLQIAIAAWVSWWVLTHVKVISPRGGGGTGGRTTTQQQPTGSGGTGTQVNPAGDEQVKPNNASPWISEAEVLELLGKDKEYLDLLIPQMEGMFRTPVLMQKDGKTLYHREHFKSFKAGGLPLLEDLRKQHPNGAPPPKPPQPLTEGDLLKE